MTAFFDTNVLIYAFLDVPKTKRARQAMSVGGMISAQVLNEFVNVAYRKHSRSWTDISEALVVIRQRFPKILPLSSETNSIAVTLARDHMIAFYDALILASAIECNASILVTEDFQHLRRFGNLTIVNPFLD